MAASKSLDIKNALVSLLQAVQLDGETAFTEVRGHTRGEFNGYPSIRVLPLDVSNEQGAQSQMDKTVAFSVRTHLPIGDGSEFDRMYILTDLILDTIDQADNDDDLRAALGTNLMSATRGLWGEMETQRGVVLYADINVEVSYSKDL